MYNHYICSNNIVYCADIRSLKSSKFVRMKASVCYLGVLLKGKHIGSICLLSVVLYLIKTISPIWTRIHCRWRLQSLSLSSKPTAFEHAGKAFYRATPCCDTGPRFLWSHLKSHSYVISFFDKQGIYEALYLTEITRDICKCPHVYRIRFFQCNIKKNNVMLLSGREQCFGQKGPL